MPVENRKAEPLEASPVPFAAMYPNMRYFEIDSVLADARYAVWVSVPEAYEESPQRSFAAIYMPDGNWNAMNSAGLCDLDRWDLMERFQPTIQVCVGYPPAEAKNALAIRARDLLPPKEGLLPGTVEGVLKMAESSELLERAGVELYAHYLQNPAADRFLAFLTEELHPLLTAEYRIDAASVGLFGHSYGGLFATYAALQKKTIFRHICASSPGIVVGASKVFDLHAAAVADGGFEERDLLLTVAAREISDPTAYQPMVGAGSVEFMRVAGQAPLNGLNFIGEIIGTETHVTVKPAAIYSFLRRYYLRK